MVAVHGSRCITLRTKGVDPRETARAHEPGVLRPQVGKVFTKLDVNSSNKLREALAGTSRKP